MQHTPLYFVEVEGMEEIDDLKLFFNSRCDRWNYQTCESFGGFQDSDLKEGETYN